LGTADADAVRLILEHRGEQPVRLFSLDGRPHLKLVGVPVPDLTAHGSLTAGGGAVKKLETKSTVLLKHHLKALKLPTMTAECEKVAGRCAKEIADHLSFLLQLGELELLDRERRAAARRLKAARFPTPKGLDGFDLAAAPSVNKHIII
jgi:IstB-like ATP binding protein